MMIAFFIIKSFIFVVFDLVAYSSTAGTDRSKLGTNRSKEYFFNSIF